MPCQCKINGPSPSLRYWAVHISGFLHADKEKKSSGIPTKDGSWQTQRKLNHSTGPLWGYIGPHSSRKIQTGFLHYGTVRNPGQVGIGELFGIAILQSSSASLVLIGPHTINEVKLMALRSTSMKHPALHTTSLWKRTLNVPSSGPWANVLPPWAFPDIGDKVHSLVKSPPHIFQPCWPKCEWIGKARSHVSCNNHSKLEVPIHQQPSWLH